MIRKVILLLALIICAASSVEAAPNNGFPFDPLATTASESDSGALTLIRMKDTGELCFLIADNQAQAMGMVPYTSRIYDFYMHKDKKGYQPFIFVMVLPMETRGQIDDELGAWQEKFHLLPVYALFDVEKGGKVLCKKPFYSARGLNPSHYQDTIRNPNHERLIEIFLTHMPQLHRLIRDQKISLP